MTSPIRPRPGRGIDHSPARATNFRVFVSRFPHLQFYTTDTVVPGLNLGDIQTPFQGRGNAFISDNVLEWDLLTLGFVVDEELKSYTEIFEWLTDYLSPTDLRQEQEPEPIEVDIQALDNNKNPMVTFRMKDARPTVLGQLTYDTQDENNTQLVCDLTMRFDSMKIIRHGSENPTGLDDAFGSVTE